MNYLAKIGQAIVIAWGGIGMSLAQIPFECNGKMFRSIEKDSGSQLQEVTFQREDKSLHIEDIAFFPGYKVNGVCFRPDDNMIYGVLLGETYRLCRIDGGYNLTKLAELPLPPQLLFVAGDISPDGRYLVLLGFSHNEPKNLLALVDLEDPNFTTTMLPVGITGNATSISCADIAFHPTTGELYGYNHRDHRIIKVDIENQIIDNTTYPEEKVKYGVVPTIFFSPSGHLYGFGTESNNYTKRYFMEFNLKNGQITQHQPMGFEGNQDGCSCPFQLKVLNKIEQRAIFPCTTVDFDIVIINRTPFDFADITFRDTFPEGIKIVDVNRNPFEGGPLNGTPSNVLAIDHMIIPQGVDTINLTVEINRDISIGYHQNQVALSNLDMETIAPGGVLLSDDPGTTITNDPTEFVIVPLTVDFGGTELPKCPGAPLLLDPNINGALKYEWNTGEETPAILVDEPGNYKLDVYTSCGEASAWVSVYEDELNIHLDNELTLEEGERVQLQPKISSKSPIQFTNWTELPGRNTLECRTCPEPHLTATASNRYELEVKNQNGCTRKALVDISINSFNHYTPNVFSPNADGKNDIFYIQGQKVYNLEAFRIFDRWGNLLFQRLNGITNTPDDGWDGMSNGKMMTSGIYVWSANVEAKDGSIRKLSGDVLLKN